MLIVYLTNTKNQYIINRKIMTNNSCPKRISYATQFTSNDIYFQEEQQPVKSPEDQHQEISIRKQDEHNSKQQFDKDNSSISIDMKIEKKSLNHNFQKHAVVTIKKLMKIKCNSACSDAERLANKMWKIFMVINIKSKKILVVLFGVVNLEDQRDRQLFEKCGFGQILKEEQCLIRKAQQILRMKFIGTVNEQAVRQNIKNFRNIKLSDEFYIYFVELLRMIRNGPFMKLRINDKTAKKIQDEINNKIVSGETLN